MIRTGAIAAGGFVAGAALSASATLALQSREAGPIGTTQHSRDVLNFALGGTVGLGTLIGGLTSRAMGARSSWLVAPACFGATAGALLGSYLVAPATRRYLAEH
jgi:hypothetical protein